MKISQSFRVAAAPEIVFDYVVDPDNLRERQTTKTRVEVLTDGPPRAGFRIREWTKPPGGKEFEQVVEFSSFDRPSRLMVHIVEGPQPIDGTWTFTADGDGTRVGFVAAGSLRGPMRFAGPLVRRMLDRQFRGYHENLRRNVETSA